MSSAPQQAELLPTVSVIVPTYRRAHRLEKTLRPLLADPATTELVVVADGGDDGSGDVVGRLAEADNRVRLLTPPHGGPRSAVAVGLKHATGEVVLLLDDDVVARPGLVTGHARHHQGARGLVVVGYMPCVPTQSAGGVPLLTRIYGKEYEAQCAAFERDPSLVLRQLWGGNLSLRRADCEAVGLTPWPYAHEDWDFGLRCLRQGLSGTFDRHLYAEHEHERDAKTFLSNARAFGAGRAYMHQVHGDMLGPLDVDKEFGHVPTVLRPLISVVAIPGRSHLVTAPVVRLAGLAGSLHMTVIESAAYRLARRVEMRVGAKEVELAAGAAGH